MKMKKIGLLCISLILVVSLGLAACEIKNSDEMGSDKDEKAKTEKTVELNVLAAASMTDVLNELGETYKATHKDVKLNFSYGSSGALQTQIEEGAPADIFISAGAKQMDALAEKNLIAADTRKDLLGNDVVLVTPKDSKLGLTSFEDVASDKVKRVAVGGENVPVGQYTQQVFEYYKVWDKIKAKASLGEDVRQVLSWVESGDADCGIVYKTDALTTDKVTVAAAAAADTHKPVLYPEAVVAASKNQDAAKEFLEFLSSPEAKAVFEKAGFTVL
ncbi:MAG: molybdate ABC transporter substrate-binding protein [Clostridiales Family XIII bacterium]|nr:molybdate ABC transporter substrate-binding protein [Clostridiales Family XIII bacterium]